MREVRAGAARETLTVLYDAAAISGAVRRIARAVGEDLRGAPVYVVPVLDAALFFAVDLLRALGEDAVVAGVGAASVSTYGDAEAPAGPPRIAAFPEAREVEGRAVLVVDTVVDTGATAHAVLEEARARGAASVALACLLDKRARRRFPVAVRYAGFEAPDRFLVGYGLDRAGRHRALPHVAAVVADAP
jgi:hypoxanthine phosphoribosyltransferase